MKKSRIIILLTALLCCIVFTGCSNQSESTSETSTPETITENTTKEIVDENLLNVDITVPASMFGEENPASEELTQEQKDKGFKSAKINDDGSVTYTMSKKAFKEYKEEMLKSAKDQITAVKDTYSSVKEIEINDNLSEVKLKVSKIEYDSSSDYLSIYQAGMLCNFYQAYIGEKINTTVSAIDKDTGKVIESGTYPEKSK